MSRVTLTNPFDLLTDENEDRTNVPTPKKEKPAAPGKSAAKPAASSAAVAKPAAKPEAKAPAKPAEAKPAAKPAAVASKPPAGNSANQVVKPPPPREANQNLQERDKETRIPRDKRDRPARPPTDGKRAFDRHSGTGRPKNELTRGGHGRGNWGGEVDAKEGVEALKDKEEKVEEKEEGEEAKEEKPAAEGEKKEGEPAKEGEATPAAAAANKDEETLTYDEYLKTRKAKAPQVEALKPRTVTDTDFGAAGFVPLQREANGAAAPKKEKKEKVVEKTEKADKPAGEKKENLAAKLLTFASHQDARRQERGSYRSYDDRRGGERRGGGGGGAPRNPRGPRPDHPNKNNNTSASQPPVQEKDFPALGPHGTESVKA